MQIGTKIKDLRRSRDMTQEQLAEYMNVSVSAVSQWELGKTTPDITLVPVLCRLFRVSADELFGIDIDKREEEINAVINNADDLYSHGDNDGVVRVLREGLARYPDSVEIMGFCLATYLFPNDERVMLSEKILELTDKPCCDYFIAAENLAFHYAESDEERAESMLELFSHDSQGDVRSRLYKGDKRINADMEFLFAELLQKMAAHMRLNFKRDDGEWFYDDDDMIARNEKVIELIRLMFEDGDFGFYYTYLAEAPLNIAHIMARKGDTDGAIRHIEESAHAAVKMDEFIASGGTTHTSVCFRGYYDPSSCCCGNSEYNHAGETLIELRSPDFDALRNDPRFCETEAYLAAKAAKNP